MEFDKGTETCVLEFQTGDLLSWLSLSFSTSYNLVERINTKKDPSFLLYPILLYWINYCIESKFGLNRSKKSDQITFGCLLKMNIKKRKVMYSKRFHWIGKTVLCKTQVSYCLLYSFIYFNSKLWSSLQTFNSIHKKKKKKRSVNPNEFLSFQKGQWGSI